MIFLSELLADSSKIEDFWSLERHVSAAARRDPNSDIKTLRFDVEPEYRCTPKKWQMILTAAYERGLRARG